MIYKELCFQKIEFSNREQEALILDWPLHLECLNLSARYFRHYLRLKFCNCCKMDFQQCHLASLTW